jgi:uncharacterized pyridoxamine 5'-phosphate oxidase family protein
MQIESTLIVNFSDIPDTYSQRLEIWFNSNNNYYFAQSFLYNGKKFIEYFLKIEGKGLFRVFTAYQEKSIDIKVNSIWDLISGEIEYKDQQNYCKIYFQEVPKISFLFKLNSTLSKLKEVYISLTII